ncbi:trypco2 family protein [Streptomyces spinosus]|uniref:trypco2 family protein n=1 Tax=Streptomyces spinosus TaxID=2872623 RepID=UPI001CEC8493|nr:trypco2 family protein [Streptomyces spinosus]
MIELSEMIAQLRAELVTAMAEGEGEDLRFALGPVELELSVGVQRDAAASGKVRFWVAELGADGRVGRQDTQTVRLTLEPRRTAEAGEPPSEVLIGGLSEAGEV